MQKSLELSTLDRLMRMMYRDDGRPALCGRLVAGGGGRLFWMGVAEGLVGDAILKRVIWLTTRRLARQVSASAMVCGGGVEVEVESGVRRAAAKAYIWLGGGSGRTISLWC